MKMLNALKKLIRYRKEQEVEYTVTKPVRGPDGKPAKHLEVMETGKKLHITEGWFKKTEEVVEL